jgi:hypothetical protein
MTVGSQPWPRAGGHPPLPWRRTRVGRKPRCPIVRCSPAKRTYENTTQRLRSCYAGRLVKRELVRIMLTTLARVKPWRRQDVYRHHSQERVDAWRHHRPRRRDQGRSPLPSCACPRPGQDGRGRGIEGPCGSPTGPQADRSTLSPPTMVTDGRCQSSSAMEPESRGEGAT